MQGNLIAYFVDHRSTVCCALLAPAAIVAAIGGIGVVGAALIGPWLMRVAFGPEYRTSGVLLAWLTVAAVSIALLTPDGCGDGRLRPAPGLFDRLGGATVAAAVLLTLPLSLESRTVIALMCGPLVGIGVHLTALARAD